MAEDEDKKDSSTRLVVAVPYIQSLWESLSNAVDDARPFQFVDAPEVTIPTTDL